jgi:hypothetical protein
VRSSIIISLSKRLARLAARGYRCWPDWWEYMVWWTVAGGLSIAIVFLIACVAGGRGAMHGA